jgi:hypothetical protein
MQVSLHDHREQRLITRWSPRAHHHRCSRRTGCRPAGDSPESAGAVLAVGGSSRRARTGFWAANQTAQLLRIAVRAASRTTSSRSAPRPPTRAAIGSGALRDPHHPRMSRTERPDLRRMGTGNVALTWHNSRSVAKLRQQPPGYARPRRHDSASCLVNGGGVQPQDIEGRCLKTSRTVAGGTGVAAGLAG